MSSTKKIITIISACFQLILCGIFLYLEFTDGTIQNSSFPIQKVSVQNEFVILNSNNPVLETPPSNSSGTITKINTFTIMSFVLMLAFLGILIFFKKTKEKATGYFRLTAVLFTIYLIVISVFSFVNFITAPDLNTLTDNNGETLFFSDQPTEETTPDETTFQIYCGDN